MAIKIKGLTVIDDNRNVPSANVITATSATLSTALSVSSGGTGATSLNGVVRGNGTSPFTTGSVNLASEVTGTLPVSSGGTGATTLTGVVKASGTDAFTAGTVNLGSEVTGDLPFSNLTQGSALSVLGVSGNATADHASITAGSDHQVLRRSGTAVGFGSIQLDQAAAVNGTLAAGNGGTGLSSAGTAGNVLTSTGSGWTSSPAAAFDAGTVMLFAQTTAPTGWTKDTTNYNNSGLRVVTGTASTGGSVDFTTAFASKTPTGSVTITAVSGSAGSTTLSTPQIPSHTHATGNFPPIPEGVTRPRFQQNDTSPTPIATGATGGGGSHTHPFSFSSGSGTFTGNAINLAVKYVDVIRATKN